ncbi:MAG: DNA-3-methyladenine glycosylase [Spirochaetales bacterium]|nr:DNA-3-methyladenine glycosylase [Spirochaetales bacterium]
MNGSEIHPDSYLEHPALLAPDLLGKVLSLRTPAGNISVRITEVEAYSPDDPASHSFNGPTKRNHSMFKTGGCLYIYQIYGIHECLNIVTQAEGTGSAVLIRSGTPVCGFELMWTNRFPDTPFPGLKVVEGEIRESVEKQKPISSQYLRLTCGPGNLCLAMGFSRKLHDGLIIGGDEVSIRDDGFCRDGTKSISTSARIGISKGVDTPWRFFFTDNAWHTPGPRINL